MRKLCKNIYISLNKGYLVVFVVFLYFMCRQCCEKNTPLTCFIPRRTARVAARYVPLSLCSSKPELICLNLVVDAH